MPSLRPRSRTSLLLLVVIAAVVGVAVAAQGAAPPRLPSITPERLVTNVMSALADPPPVSGLVRTHVGLGLPSIPAQAGQPPDAASRLIDALNGDHRVRVWRSEHGARLAELLPTAEIGLFVRRDQTSAQAWAWDSASFTAYRLGPIRTGTAMPAHPVGLLDPASLAALTLEAIQPTTEVTSGPSTRIAGRDAYLLVLQPKTTQTLVGRIELAVDAERWVPLSVAVYARRAESAALSAAFESVRFDPIDPATYEFTPPAGARVVASDAEARHDRLPAPRQHAVDVDGSNARDPVRLFGSGWDTVIAIRIDRHADDGDLGIRDMLPLSGPLFSARLADRETFWWVLIGTVPQERLATIERSLP
ncbi:MAG: outer membrane lipoprotein carrier protein LolA [Actinomycetota bacterium]